MKRYRYCTTEEAIPTGNPMIPIELRTYNHRFASALLVEILCDAFRGSELLRPALVSLHEIFGNVRALEDLRREDVRRRKP